MTQPQTDSLGRATFHHIAPQSHVRPTEREIRWFKHLERHGPQSSQYLYELTRDTHRCRDTALRQMQKLRAGGYLALPRQQRATERAEFNPYIYDLTKKAKDHLRDLGLDEPTVHPTGHWWHGYTVSCVTGSIDIAAAREGVRYIPTHEILSRTGADLAIPVAGTKLIPDQLFALDYGGSYRAFALEVDRGTEPKTSPARRKSWARSIEQYQHVIERQLYKRHYGLKANLIVLWVFSSRTDRERFLKLASSTAPKLAPYVLGQVVGGDVIARAAPRIETRLFDGHWMRPDRSRVRICCV
ncbi:replication-relaxation family protein [Roseovarius nitratireducens]|uniref:replication-relaxation family protein n=1 Tax=Roseovarius nitratireducens TaxID=2044597 RepID=UPI000CE1D46B|nr:replication-relaxation family protein [Roseovarius nitratireducens]